LIPLADSRRRRRRPWVTWTIAAGCAAAFAWELGLGDRLAAELARVAVSPREIVALADPLTLPARVVAAMFLHGGWLHLGANLAFLLVFADDVETAMPRRRFLALYLLCGLVATLAQTAATPRSTVPMIGASGAIAGVLGAFLVRFPRARLSGVLPIGCLWIPMSTRAWLFLPGWFLLQLVSALVAPPGSGSGGVAFYAHLAGFAAGPPLLFLLGGRRGLSRSRRS
jgi:membrane associated rhomboid family serine protease